MISVTTCCLGILLLVFIVFFAVYMHTNSRTYKYCNQGAISNPLMYEPEIETGEDKGRVFNQKLVCYPRGKCHGCKTNAATVCSCHTDTCTAEEEGKYCPNGYPGSTGHAWYDWFPGVETIDNWADGEGYYCKNGEWIRGTDGGKVARPQCHECCSNDDYCTKKCTGLTAQQKVDCGSECQQDSEC